ncbi:MAG: DUF294 nucleotidyltransferase-like domain-containing protein [Pseudomonadota bacterium]
MALCDPTRQFLASVHPYDSLSEADVLALASACAQTELPAGESVFAVGDAVENLYIIMAGEIEIKDEADVQLSLLGPRNSFGERALTRGGLATRTALATTDTSLIVMPSATLFALMDNHTQIARFFDRRHPARPQTPDLTTLTVDQLMTSEPVTCPPDLAVHEAAAKMRERKISSICVADQGDLKGIVTVRDMSERVVASATAPDQPVSGIMTPAPVTLEPSALGMDVLHTMMERGIGHIPITQAGKLVGIVSQTDLTRAQAASSADLVRQIAKAEDVRAMARITSKIPQLLVQLVAAGNRHEVVTRLITDLADTATRKLLAFAEEELGPPPVPYVWLACGSQGRQEQTGVSDQDNCLILADTVTDDDMTYFAKLAKYVSGGLDTCGYYYCPGDMMATNPRWCQPLKVWRSYFEGWISKPNPEAQMLASVMFDLRAIGGKESLFTDLQKTTLDAASKNSIFTAHMIANSLKHQPPLGLLRGLATIRSGEHRDRLDLKLNGVVPVVDLGRIYALQGRLRPVNTRARLSAAQAGGILSPSGGADLIDAYDLIATMRLEHQLEQVKAGGKPDNFLDPSELSDFERSHLRDAFVVIKTMQSAVGSGTGILG